MIIQASRNKVFRRIHDGHIMGERINLGVDFSTGTPRQDLAEYYEEVDNADKAVIIETYVSVENTEKAKEIFPEWNPNESVWAKDLEKPADCRLRDGVLYRCILSHTTQEDWPPEETPAMWGRIMFPNETIEWYPEIHLVIQVGEQVQWNGKVYKCENQTFAWIEPGTQDSEYGWTYLYDL